MQELFRVVDGRMETEESWSLNRYNMHICAGEILYIQGSPESGLHCLVELFTGRRMLQGGKIFVRECRCMAVTKERIREAGIYTITAEADLVKELSVAENLEVIRWVPFSLRFFNRKKIEKKVDRYLEKEGVSLQSSSMLGEVDSGACQCLSILKAKMHGAALIVLDCTRGNYEGKKGEKLCRLIKRLSTEGIAFIILSEHFLPLAGMAHRIQVIHKGYDLMEWHGMDEKLKEDLLHPGAIRTAGGKETCHVPLLYGIYDYEWETEKGFLSYLRQFSAENPLLWQYAAGIECIPESYGLQGKLAILPRTYRDLQFDSMGIEDNIIMAIPGRIAHGGKYGFIDRNFKRLITQEFYERAGVPQGVKSVAELDRAQRRILFLYRFEVAKPKTMLIDCPYIGLGQEEKARVRAYLEGLARKGIRIVYFSQSMEELQEDCKEIFCSHDGKRHQSAGFSTWDSVGPMIK